MDRVCLGNGGPLLSVKAAPHQGYTAATQGTVVAMFGVQPLEFDFSHLTLGAALRVLSFSSLMESQRLGLIDSFLPCLTFSLDYVPEF